MNRCQLFGVRLALAAAICTSLGFALLAPSVVQAQESTRREAPKDVVLGQMTVVTPPIISIDGKPDRLSPGSRIHDTRNMMVMSGALAGKTVPVVYRREPTGQVHEVWLLTADEYTKLSGIATGTQDGLSKFITTLAAIFGLRQ
jgi:hypothetical protein